MTDKYIDLADRIGEGAEYSNTASFCLGIECALRWLDEHSDQAPGRTITESRYRALTDSDPEEYRSGFSDGFFFAGGCIVPDPEPTNAEKLEALLEGDNINAQWALRDGGVMFARELAHALDDAGVKAPGASDD